MASANGKRSASESDPSDADMLSAKRSRTIENNHSIDSDEEDGEDAQAKPKYDMLKDDDVEGQEEGTLKVEEGVRITPFNIQEELDEGHFDTDGNFFVDKDKEVKDAWLDGLDQFADEDFEKLRKKKADEAAIQEFDAPAVLTDIELFKVIASILKPGESIGKALRRLGSGIKPTQRMKKGSKAAATSSDMEIDADPVKIEFDKLTSAADTLLQQGNLEIYQETYEKIQHRINKAEASMKVDDNADIFGDEFVPTKEAVKESSDNDDSSSKTLWEFKWENVDGAEMHGPYSSEQMNEWVQQDFFKDGVFVRKAGIADSKFYSSKRVDFELYI